MGRARRQGVRPCEPGQEAALWAVIFGCEGEVALSPGRTAEGGCATREPPLPASHYSDVDLLLAQAVCERATGRGLAELMAAEVLGPLGLAHTGFCPRDPAACVPTERDDRWRRRLVVGEVHDEMAATLGGVAGHAGLFAPAAEVGRFAESWLGLGAPAAAPPFLAEATRRLAFEPHSADFGLGWRRCNAASFPSLERFGAVGHLGFTGTAVFLFPKTAAVLVVLTNRVHPRRDAAPSRLPLLAEMAERVGGLTAENAEDAEKTQRREGTTNEHR